MKKKMEQDNKEVLVSRNAASGVTEANFEWKNKIKVSKVIYQRLLLFHHIILFKNLKQIF